MVCGTVNRSVLMSDRIAMNAQHTNWQNQRPDSKFKIQRTVIAVSIGLTPVQRTKASPSSTFYVLVPAFMQNICATNY